MKFLIGIIIIVIALLFFVPSFTQMNDIKQKNHEYGQQIQELTSKNAKLREELRRLKDDPEYLEKVAREKMGLIKEGEVIYRITPSETQTVE